LVAGEQFGEEGERVGGVVYWGRLEVVGGDPPHTFQELDPPIILDLEHLRLRGIKVLLQQIEETHEPHSPLLLLLQATFYVQDEFLVLSVHSEFADFGDLAVPLDSVVGPIVGGGGRGSGGDPDSDLEQVLHFT